MIVTKKTTDAQQIKNLQKENKILIAENNAINQDVAKLQKKIRQSKHNDSALGTIIRAVIAAPLIIASKYIPGSRVETQWGSADILIVAGILFMFLPLIINAYKIFKAGKK